MDVNSFIFQDNHAIKKVLFITPSFNKGGAENQLFKLAVFLKKKGYKITILSFLDDNDFKDPLKNNSISFISLKAESIINRTLLLPNILKNVRKEKPDLIISFMFVANLWARLIKLVKNIPIITSVRSYNISNKYFWIYRFSYKLDNITTFNSGAALQKFTKNRLTNPSKSILVNNAVSIRPTQPNNYNNDCFTWICIAHFRPAKDYKTLFNAIQLIKEKGILINLLVLGHLYEEIWPGEMLKELNIQNEVKIVGYVDDPFKYFFKANALVLSSLWEGTPNAILEAMIAGKPIVASDIPGVSELITEADCGLLFEKGNVQELADKMIRIMFFSNEERIRLGEKGRQFIIENYAEDKIMQQWVDIIEKVKLG